jgi:deferrochelatase/peroxidase EfeB
MLKLDDIQHFLLTRTPAPAARYEFLTFRQPAAGRAWLAGMIDKVGTGKSVGSASSDSRWVTVAFTWNGLRALGIDETSLMTFPEEFRQGMAARAEILGATGKNHPDHWLGELANPALHAVVVLFARDIPERERCKQEHNRYLSQIGGVDVLSTLDLEAIPPFDRGAHEHFGYRDRLSLPVIEGTGDEPTPGSGPPIKAGEFFLGYVDESGAQPGLPQPEILSRNGSYLAYLRMEEHVGVFRDFLRQHGKTREEQELMAAKLMGRWRSGAPLVLAPQKDDPALGADLQRTNNFDYGTMDPYGYSCPVGSHIRRMNPRDTSDNMQRHKMIRRGGTYGPPLPEDAPEDDVERGIAAFIGCASLVRQFEFAMNVWANDPQFEELGNERDPFIGTQDGTFDMTIPRRPIRKKIKGLPAFTTIRGGAYFFLPGIKALRYLGAEGASVRPRST